MLQVINNQISNLLSNLGYTKPPYYSHKHSKVVRDKNLISIETLANNSLSIPGMTTPRSGQFLFALCYMQDLEGDVVEVGSWQGRSTIFLAEAVKVSGNGRFYAIDHFKGNVDKEHFYVVEREDLSDLKQNFIRNMEKFDLIESVNLIDKPNDLAVDEIQTDGIRFLFIDGDHTREGVQKDIELFSPKLKAGAIVVFDDYCENFPELVEVVDNFIKEKGISKKFYYENTLVLEYH